MNEVGNFEMREELDKGLMYNGPTLFISGSNSNYISPESHPLIQKLFPKAIIDTVPDAGHWLHFDKPNEFVAKVVPFLIQSLPEY